MNEQPEEFLSEAELMDPSNWELESAVSYPPQDAPKFVFSVTFSSAELSEIVSAARKIGLPVGQYIRLAALAGSGGHDQLESK